MTIISLLLLTSAVQAAPLAPSFETMIHEARHAAGAARAAHRSAVASALEPRLRDAAEELRRLEQESGEIRWIASELRQRLMARRASRWEVRRVGLALADHARGLSLASRELEDIRRALTAPDASLNRAADRLNLRAGWLRSAERRLALDAFFVELELRRAGYVFESFEWARLMREIDALSSRVEHEAREILARAR